MDNDTPGLDPALNRDERRAAALANLLAKVEAGDGSVLVTAQSLSAEWGVPLLTVRAWLKRWVTEEAIKTRSLGPKGTSVEAGRRTKAKATRARNASARAAGIAEAPRPKKGAKEFCVWCGAQNKVQDAFFRAACGKALPR